MSTATDLHGIASLSIANARAKLSEMVGRARYAKSPTVLTSRGKPVAALVPIEDLELIEAEIDRRLAAEALAEVEAGAATIPHAVVKREHAKRHAAAVRKRRG